MKYVSYMGRKYALESKNKMTKTEAEELNLLNKHIEDLSPEQSEENQEVKLKQKKFCLVFFKR